MSNLTRRILLADDDHQAHILTSRIITKIMPAGCSLNIVSSGNEAIAYMIGEGKFADRIQYPFPSLIISDLNMADGDGFDVLNFLQANPSWSVVPRVLFSSSEDDDDVRTAYLLGASVYHVKPLRLSELEELLRKILEYWAVAKVPPVDATGRVLVSKGAGYKWSCHHHHAEGGKSMERPKRS
jgi:CheY-like chemotaxis protein